MNASAMWRVIAVSLIALLLSMAVWRYADDDWTRFPAALGVCLFGWSFALSGAARVSASLRAPWHAPFNVAMVFCFTALGGLVFLPGPVRWFAAFAVDDQGVFRSMPDIVLARSVELAVAGPPSITHVLIAMLAGMAAYVATNAISHRAPFLMFAFTAAGVSWVVGGAFLIILVAKGAVALIAAVDSTGRKPVPGLLEFQALAGGFLRLYALCILTAYAAIVARLWRLRPVNTR